MVKVAPKSEGLQVWITAETTKTGLTGLSLVGPLYNTSTPQTLVRLQRLGRVEFGSFEQEFEEIAQVDRPQPIRSPTRENASLTVEVIGFDDSTDAILSAVHLLAAAKNWPMGFTNPTVSTAAEYNFLDDTAVTKATDLVGWAVEVVQYDAAAAVLWRRRLHNCKLDAKPIYGAGGKVVRVEVTFSDARYADMDATDKGSTHSNS
jgi:hypothetical protein